MMPEQKPNDGGPAFPFFCGDDRDPTGMTLRDYFAAKAMQAILGIPDERRFPSDKGITVEEWVASNQLADAKQCYRMADAMLKARNQ
jgi:hypothetical protein